MEQIDAGTVARWRLAASGLAAPGYASSTVVVGHLVAMQAQDLTPARWSLAQRCAVAPAQKEVEEAHDAGHFVRTHTLRPTWHFVAADDLAMVLAATSRRVRQLMAYMNRQLGVDETVMAAAHPALEQRLAEGPATRDALGDALARAGVEATGTRLAHVVMWAELAGWIGSGPSQGQRQTYRLLPTLERWDETEAQAELARAYLRTRGPVTARDLATWASLTITQSRRALEAAAPQQVQVDDRVYLHSSAPPATPSGPVVSLLQAYDELVMSYSDSRDVLTGDARLWDASDRTFMHVIVVDGRLVGHWRYERDSAGLPARVVTRLLRPLSMQEQEALAREVSRFAAFAGREVRWT